MRTPYNFQQKGYWWLSTCKRALLADEPGLGKSAQAIIAADIICAETILIIPPASVRFVWKEEIEKWSLFGHHVHVMTSTKDRPIKGCINIINYDLLARGFQKTSYQHNAFLKSLKKIVWDVIIADEAHYLKEQNSLRTMAVLGIHGLNGHTKRLWLLTGTPMPNHPGELWTILASLGATKLEYKDFIERYCELGKHGFSIGKPVGTNAANAKELNKILKGVMMRRYKEFEIPDLPACRIDDFPIPEVKIKIEHFFEEALIDKKGAKKKIKEQEEFVQEIWKKTIASDGAMRTMDMIKVLESIGPAVSLYRRWLGAVKVASLMPILEDELSTGALKKVVIFAHHKQVISFLKSKLEKYDPAIIDGSVSLTAREKAVHRFQNDPDCRVFIGQNHAAGTGLTLTAACEVINLEPDWVPAVNAQAIMRCHRIGQKLPVRARFVRLAGTLDDYMSEVLARKTREIVSIVDK